MPNTPLFSHPLFAIMPDFYNISSQNNILPDYNQSSLVGGFFFEVRSTWLALSGSFKSNNNMINKNYRNNIKNSINKSYSSIFINFVKN